MSNLGPQPCIKQLVCQAVFLYVLKAKQMRKCNINIGNTNWTSSAGRDSLNSEWIVLVNEDWSDIGQLTNPCQSSSLPGCTDPTASNYDPLATIDDGTCTYPNVCGAITGVNLTDVIHDRVTFNWDDMNQGSCVVDQIRIRYRAVGSSSWSLKTMGAPVGNNAPCLNTSKLVLNLTASTQYEYDFKIWYQDGTVVNWHAGGTFTTADAVIT